MRLPVNVFWLVASVSTAAAQSPMADRSLVDEATLSVRSLTWGVSAPVRWSSSTWFRIGAATLGLAMLSTNDGEVRDLARRNQGGFGDDLASFVKPFGKEVSAVTLAGFLVGGLLFGDSEATAIAFDGLVTSALVSGLLVPALQAATGRSRPWHGRGEYAFRPFSGHHSLPSGHAAQAFVTASVLAAHQDARWVDVTAYGFASLVALSRVYHDAHHLTDVLAGAAIGTLVGRAVVRRGEAARAGGRLAPDVHGNRIGLTYRF